MMLLDNVEKAQSGPGDAVIDRGTVRPAALAVRWCGNRRGNGASPSPRPR
jgi:hypothetical protein